MFIFEYAKINYWTSIWVESTKQMSRKCTNRMAALTVLKYYGKNLQSSLVPSIDSSVHCHHFCLIHNSAVAHLVFVRIRKKSSVVHFYNEASLIHIITHGLFSYPGRQLQQSKIIWWGKDSNAPLSSRSSIFTALIQAKSYSPFLLLWLQPPAVCMRPSSLRNIHSSTAVHFQYNHIQLRRECHKYSLSASDSQALLYLSIISSEPVTFA